jgi:flagellar basal-body rod modification protein FlgD
MAVSAQIIDGKVVANYTADTKPKATGNDSLNKDAFLNILVAEMQYQDPLQPSSNTEWVSQMASFSQIEELQGMSETITEQSATDLVGKKVIIAASEDTTGEVNYVTGEVECIERQNDGVYLSVNGYLYNLDNLYAVVDEEYYTELMKEQNKV